MVQKHLLNLYHARTAGMLSGARRVAMMLLATLLLTLTAQTAWADTGYNYKGADGTMRNTYTDDHIPDAWVTVLTDGTSYLSEGWNYVSGNVNLTNGISVSAPDAETDHYFHLILADGASLTINLESSSCISIGERCSLTIYGQTNGTGTLNVTSQNYSHAIEGGTGSSITLYGGIINANAGGSNCGIYVNSIYLAGATVYASSYGGNVSASCKYKDSDNNEYEGSIYDTGAIAGKTLTPFGTVASTSVMLDPQGGSGGTESVTVTNGAAMPTITPPTRTGYTFGGYYDGMDGAGTKYYNADGSSANNWNHTGESFVLSAKWTANTYTVNLDPQEGSGGTGSVTVTYDAAMPSATMPTREGYIFCGYFTGTNGGGIKYYNADGSSAHTWNITTDNTTLFAKWTPEEYTITFVDENGITVLQSGNVAYGQTPAYNGETPTKAATAQYTYTFSGWDPEVAQVTGDETYTATYNSTPVPYTITYEVYGGTNNESNPTTYTCESGDITLAAPTAPENSGYTFGGWYTDENFTTAVSTTAIPQGSTGEMTFYAKWLKSVTVTVNWSDNSNQDGIRPESVVVKLLANSEEDEEVTVTKPEGNPNSWTGTAVNKPVHKAGAPIVYTWAMANEKIPTGYTFGIDAENATLNLTHEPEKTEAKVNVDWDDVNNQDGKRPESVTVTLSNGAAVTLNESNNWNATVGNLPKYASGQPITYTWTEGTLPDGYSKTHTSTSTDELGVTTTTLQLSYTPEKTGATVKVVWDDNDDQDGIRPESVTVTLSNGAAVTLNESNNWNATVGNLPKYASGQPITYTWTEGTLPDGYSKTHTSTSTDELGVTTTTLQLSYTPEETEVKVTKVWDDSDNQDGKRPDDVTVNLLADDKIIDTVTLSEDNEWSYSWTRLDKKANGNDIDYTVTENAVDEYTTNITKATDGTFTYTVTNTHVLVTSGYCGTTGNEESVTWNYDTSTKTLSISGSGQMMYYDSVQDGESYSNGAPWKAFANEIEHVVISDGITYVGSNTFAHCPHISSVTLPTDQQLYEIGPGAFGDCTGLTSIDLPMSVNKIYDGAFAGCSNLATVSIGYSDPGTFTLGSDVFPVTAMLLVPESAYENYIKEKAINGNQEEINNPFYVYKNKIVPATRTFFANGTNTWMTWCDVNAWTLPEGCTAYTVSSVSGTTVTLSNALTTIPAYTPVLLHKTGTTSVKADFSAAVEGTPGIQTATGTTGCTFYGTTTELTPAIPVDNYVEGQTYILRGDKFIKADDNEGIAANKCWLVTGTSSSRQLSIVIDDESTGIEELKNGRIEELKSAGAWYSLDGRKLDGKPTKKGLYINNGKKTVISKE